MSEFGYGFGDGCLGFLGVDFLDGREEVGFVERVAVVTGDVGAVDCGSHGGCRGRRGGCSRGFG